MPLTAAARPVRYSLSMQDRDKNRSNASIAFSSTISIADLVTNLAAIEALVAALSDAYIVDGTISIDLRQTSLPAVPPPETSDVERKGSFTFTTAVEGSFAKIEIPSISNGLVIDKTNLIDEANPAVAAFIAFMTGGLVGLTGNPVNGVGNDIVALANARKIHRASSKG
jgi:hypothetical protein